MYLPLSPRGEEICWWLFKYIPLKVSYTLHNGRDYYSFILFKIINLRMFVGRQTSRGIWKCGHHQHPKIHKNCANAHKFLSTEQYFWPKKHAYRMHFPTTKPAHYRYTANICVVASSAYKIHVNEMRVWLCVIIEVAWRGMHFLLFVLFGIK